MHLSRAPQRLAGLALLALAACGPAAQAPAPSWMDPGEGAVGASSGLEVERFFPLVHGNIWQYATTSAQGGRGLLVVRAHRTDASGGELRTPTGTRRIEYTPAGVALVGLGYFLLRTPLAVNTTWNGEHGGLARITQVGATIDVPAGRFTGCVVAVEERAGAQPVRYTTTFCPEVGVTALVVESGPASERAELRSYGPPVSIGPDGHSMSTAPP